MIKAVFFNRNFSAMPTDSQFEAEAVRYSWAALGGPYRATLHINHIPGVWDYAKLLRSPVELYDDQTGLFLWWGFVSKITIPAGVMQVGISVDDMTNHVTVNYPNLVAGSTVASTSNLTTSAQDADSVSAFGYKEQIIQAHDIDSAGAAYLRDKYLAEHKNPTATISPGGGRTVIVECQGWFTTLLWRYYDNAITTLTETTSQIATIVSSKGQFITGVDLVTGSGISTNPFTDGKRKAGDLVSDLLSLGTSGGLRLAAIVTRERRLVIEAQSSTQTVLSNSGQLLTALGEVIPPERCTVNRMCKIQGVPDSVGVFNSIPPFYIGRAEYTASRGKAIYTPDNARKNYDIGML